MKKSLQYALLLFVGTFIFCGCSVDGSADIDDTYLIDLSLSSGALTPPFNRSTTSYTDEVDYDISSITVVATVVGVGETVTVQGQAVASGVASQPINLNVGQNIIPIVVAAQDTITTTTYSVVVSRLNAAKAPSNNANLSGLSLSTGSLSPAFDENTISYIADVAYGTQSITVTPTVAEVGATVKVNNASVTSGTASLSIDLDVDTNISVAVTAQDTTTTKTYIIEPNFIYCSDHNDGHVTFTYDGNEVTYGTVVSAGSRCWLDRNLGASMDCDPKDYTAHNDDRGYGDLFQWGRGDDGHQNRDSDTTNTLSETDVPGHGAFISGAEFLMTGEVQRMMTFGRE